MKVFFIAIFTICLLVPVFAQDANVSIYQALNNSMDAAIEHNTEALANFDNLIVHDNQGKVYAQFKIRYESLDRALRESEITLERLIRFNAASANLRAERNRYANLLQQLEDVKLEYGSWLGTVQ